MTHQIDLVQEEIIEAFSFFEDWSDKYEHIIEEGKSLEKMPLEYQTDENKVKGCQSNVWLHGNFENGKLFFYGNSDALIVKGLVALVLKTYSNKTPEEILQTQPYFIDTIGLGQHLSAHRSNGLSSMVKQIKHFAVAYSNQE
jgi:cysteine desulfuration protein SufE